MNKITITQALAELTLIKRKIASETDMMIPYIARHDGSGRDPLAAEGSTSAKYVAARLQAVAALEQRYLDIKSAVEKSNYDTQLTIGKQTMSIERWLVWRRDLSELHKTMLNRIRLQIFAIRKDAERGGSPDPVTGKRAVYETTVNVNETDLNEQIKEMEELLSNLDSMLSVLNATTFVEVP